jgi:hypothetical protein
MSIHFSFYVRLLRFEMNRTEGRKRRPDIKAIRDHARSGSSTRTAPGHRHHAMHCCHCAWGTPNKCWVNGSRRNDINIAVQCCAQCMPPTRIGPDYPGYPEPCQHYKMVQHPPPDFRSLNVKSAALVAASKTSSTPSPVKLEHSRYFLAPHD